MQKIAKSLEAAFAWSRSLLCRIVVKLQFQLFNNVDRFSQWVAISQEDMSKKKRLTGGMQELAVELLFSANKTKGQFSYWSEPQKKNNDFLDMASLWLTMPSKTIIKADVCGAQRVDVSQKLVLFFNKSWVSYCD